MGKQWKQWQTLFSWAPKLLQMVKLKRCFLLGRKAMTNLDSILKSRDITLPTKVHLVKAMVFPVVMYGCESWPMKKAEHWRINASELWSWIRLLRAPWTAAAAKLLQLCPTLCDSIDSSPPGSPVPGILQARTLEWVHGLLGDPISQS